MAHDAKRLGDMSIEALMTAADAAGYVMVSEDELPEAFGRTPSLFDFKTVPSTAVAIWRPVVPSIDGKPIQRSATDAWHWLMGRFQTGVTA
jgi:hypothetical protein